MICVVEPTGNADDHDVVEGSEGQQAFRGLTCHGGADADDTGQNRPRSDPPGMGEDGIVPGPGQRAGPDDGL